MSLKSEIIDHIIKIEGGYVNDPSDSGGETNYGITVAVARSYGYRGDMRDLPRRVAFEIYGARYWDSVMGDRLATLSDYITREVVDTAVNMGPAQAAVFLQRCLNVFNQRERLYPDLVVDGRIGQKTIGALRSYLEVRNELVLCKALNCLQGFAYIDLAERRDTDERFVYGWLLNRVTL